MTYKLMAVDVDGTLLNSSGILTEETIKAIKLGVEKGLIFTISTGRPIQGVEPITKMLNIDFPVITYNGAMVVMGKSREILFEQKLSPQSTREIIDLSKKYNPSLMIWSENKLYVTQIDDRTEKYKKISGIEPILVNNIEDAIKTGATKVLWYDETENIGRYQRAVQKHFEGRVNCHTSRPYFLEFVDINASKAIAMEKLGQHYNIKQGEMIAIGDGYNDLSMIEYAGLGIVMDNADYKIKKIADFVTLSNDEDGVAYAIYKFVINGN